VKLKDISLVALVLCVVATLGLAEPLTAAGPQAQSKNGKNLHRTFSSPNAVVIPDATTANPYPSTIEVSGFKKGKIKDVDLRLRGFNHGNSDDVDVLLVAPNGRTAVLMSDVGGNTNAASLTLILDDEATTPLPDGAPLTSGAFQPANHVGAIDDFPGAPAPSGQTALSTFNGGNPNGTWQLFVVDNAGGNSGAFSGGWDLTIAVKVKKDKKHNKH
jgi:subtilisin-like proprotein convertase family protein